MLVEEKNAHYFQHITSKFGTDCLIYVTIMEIIVYGKELKLCYSMRHLIYRSTNRK
jgi:hypothetical protein